MALIENTATPTFVVVDPSTGMLVQPVMIPVAQPMFPVPQAVAPRRVEKSTLPPQVQEKFRKTRICGFFLQGKCIRDSTCRFAHSPDELQVAPDLTKTKLCFNYFRHRCTDPDCKFAHGYHELRGTDGVYKTEMCRWWMEGVCKAGDACRYAHGERELRIPETRKDEIEEISELPENFNDGAVLQVKGTFVELASADSEEPLLRRLRRSFSEGDVWDLIKGVDSDSETTAPDDSSKSSDSDAESTSDSVPSIPPGCWAQDEPVVVEQRTTLVLQDIPRAYTRPMLEEMLDDEGYTGKYDFIYLPSDFKCLQGNGYAFVNMISTELAEQAMIELDGFSDWKVASNKSLRVGWSDVQGMEAHIEKFRNSPVMHDSVPDDAKPALFQEGERIAFPEPTRKIRLPRLRRSPMPEPKPELDA
jgi:hypothetical protein